MLKLLMAAEILGKGFRLFIDNFYMSVELMEDLWARGTYAYIRPHQIQVSGCPEHPTNPPGLPKITEWEPQRLPRKSSEIFEN